MVSDDVASALSGTEMNVCDIYVDVGCPTGHDMQCFNDSGHKDATGGQHWNEKVSVECM